jgi:hypothetical protein
MEIHSVQNATIEQQIEALKQAHVPKKRPEPFVDPIREFARVSRYEGMVRNWLTYPVEERKRLIRDSFTFVPRIQPDEQGRTVGETDQQHQERQMERWRALCVVIQEESRVRLDENGNIIKGSPEVAIGALKHLFHDHSWKAPAPPATPEK